MANDPEGYKAWNELRGRWQAADQKARAARAKVMQAQIACAARTGPDPSEKELAAVEKLEAIATGLSIEMDEFVKGKLG